MSQGSPTTQPEAPTSTSLTLEVSTVTGTRSYCARGVDPSLPADVVSKAMSAQLALPQNVCWMFRKDDSAEFLDGQRAIGEQVKDGAQVTLTPRAHLG